MEFEWDRKKSQSNKSKHGIAFNDAKRLWKDINRIEIQTSFQDEDRNIMIGEIDGKLWAAVFTFRSSICRIISVRRARKKEAILYEKNKDR